MKADRGWASSIVLSLGCEIVSAFPFRSMDMISHPQWVPVNIHYVLYFPAFEPHHEKTGLLHMRKQRRRSAVQ